MHPKNTKKWNIEWVSFSNPSIALRALVMSNALVLLGCAIHENFTVGATIDAFIDLSFILQPICLLSVLLWGQLDKIKKEHFKAFFFFLIPLLAALPVYYASIQLMDIPYSLDNIFLYSQLLALALLIYFDWRQKSLSPALLEAQINELQSKIKPHFFFNTICGITTLIYTDPQKAEDALLNLADIFRASLKKHSTFCTLEEEIQLSKKYLFIEAMRFGERLDIQWDISADALPYKIPSLILQPLIENAITHGTEEGAVGTIHITCQIEVQRQQLILQVSNPFNPPADQDQSVNARLTATRKGTGSAIKNIAQRLDLLFQEHASFESAAKGSYWVSRICIEMRVLSNQ